MLKNQLATRWLYQHILFSHCGLLPCKRLGVNEDSFCFQKEMNAFTCLNLLI